MRAQRARPDSPPPSPPRRILRGPPPLPPRKIFTLCVQRVTLPRMWFKYQEKAALREVREKLEELSRQVRELLEEWELVHKRMVRAYRNNARTLADIEAVENRRGGGDAEPQEETILESGNPTHGMLTPRQRAITQQILHRRMGRQ